MRSVTLLAIALPLITALPLDDAAPAQNLERRSTAPGGAIRNGPADEMYAHVGGPDWKDMEADCAKKPSDGDGMAPKAPPPPPPKKTGVDGETECAAGDGESKSETVAKGSGGPPPPPPPPPPPKSAPPPPNKDMKPPSHPTAKPAPRPSGQGMKPQPDSVPKPAPPPPGQDMKPPSPPAAKPAPRPSGQNVKPQPSPAAKPASTPRGQDTPSQPAPNANTAPPTPNEGAGNGTETDAGAVPADAKAGLALHNEYRALHNAPALAWDEGLAKMAQDWANGCKFAHGGTDQGTGQNLYASSGSMSSKGGDYLSAPTKDWYSEEPKYAQGGYKEPAQFGSTGHFTQVVWKGTTKLGCAKNTVQCSQTIVVCNYKQAGNMMGAYAQNVFPPTSSATPAGGQGSGQGSGGQGSGGQGSGTPGSGGQGYPYM